MNCDAMAAKSLPNSLKAVCNLESSSSAQAGLASDVRRLTVTIRVPGASEATMCASAAELDELAVAADSEAIGTLTSS
jgi:hypothetical protein